MHMDAFSIIHSLQNCDYLEASLTLTGRHIPLLNYEIRPIDLNTNIHACNDTGYVFDSTSDINPEVMLWS